MADAVFRSEQFRYEALGPGVWAAIALAGAGAASNCGIVDTGFSSLVFDTGMTPRAARDLRAAARVLSGKEPLEVVNSHWHLEHTLGNRVFGGSTIRGTLATQELLARNAAGVAAQVNDPSWSRIAADAEARRDAEARPRHRAELVVEAAARRDLGETRDALALRVPDEPFRDRYIYPGRQDVMIVEGAGHSESDTILFHPEAEVMFTGDLVVVGVHPNLSSADVPRWLQALERIERAGPKALVPGHGPVADAKACATLAAYLRRMTELSRDPDPVPVPEEYEAWDRPSLFARNLAALRGRGGGPHAPR